jgi:hypothetical membrane protein
VKTVQSVPWWGVVSSAASPVLLIGGGTIAAMLQPPSYNPVADTVSSLAALGATDRWFMTLIFLAVGTCYIITAAALRAAAPAGRLILAAGAAAGMLVAAYPEPPGSGSVPHAICATLGFAGLAVWPAGAWRHGPSVPWGLRPDACAGDIAVQLILLAWFAAELLTGTGEAGLAERIVGAAQAAWPLVVVLSSHAGHRTRAGIGRQPALAVAEDHPLTRRQGRSHPSRARRAAGLLLPWWLPASCLGFVIAPSPAPPGCSPPCRKQNSPPMGAGEGRL